MKDKIQPVNSAKKIFSEDLKLNESRNISTKLEKKILKFKKLCFPDTLSFKFP